MFKVSEISSWINASIANPEFAKSEAGAQSLGVEIQKLNTLKEAGPGDLAFFFSKYYQDDLMKTRASVIVTGRAFVDAIKAANLPQWKTAIWLACDDPYVALGVVSAQFSKKISRHDHQDLPAVASVHSSAVVHASAKVGARVDIGVGVVIEKDVVIEDGVTLYPHCYVGPSCHIGEGTVLFPRVTLYEGTQIGKRVRIHAGSVIGADGFGYAPIKDPATKKQIGHQKIYHLGRVVIEDDVEIGALSSIDRGTLGDTLIQKNAKIDNQVQIGHNCTVGEGAVMCGASGMAGSSSLGKFVVVAAQSGTGNQVHVGDYSTLVAYTGVSKDVPPDSEMAGMPARPLKEFAMLLAMQNRSLKDREKGRDKNRGDK